MTDTRGLIVTIGAVLSTLALIGLVVLQLLQWQESRDDFEQVRRDIRQPRYEYKVLAVQSEGHERTGESALKFATVTPSEAELSKLGAAGWEVVGSYLEMETAYPNFGKAEYVTGLQPNIRPQRVVMILRRRMG